MSGLAPSTRACALVVVLGLAALAVVACSGTPQLAPLGPDARVLAFGDSLTHGTGAKPGASYPAVLENLIDREVVRSGVPGEVAAEGRRRLPGVLERVRPDLLILCHGGNDILRGGEPASIRADLEAMIEQARSRGVAVVLIGVPERGLFPETADVYHEIAEARDVPLEDAIIETIIDTPSLRSDRVHPNAAGYRRIAEAVRDLLVDAGAIRGPD